MSCTVPCTQIMYCPFFDPGPEIQYHWQVRFLLGNSFTVAVQKSHRYCQKQYKPSVFGLALKNFKSRGKDIILVEVLNPGLINSAAIER